MQRFVIKISFQNSVFYWKQKSYGFANCMMSANLQDAAVFESFNSAMKRLKDMKNSISRRLDDPTLMSHTINEHTTWSMFMNVEVLEVELKLKVDVR